VHPLECQYSSPCNFMSRQEISRKRRRCCGSRGRFLSVAAALLLFVLCFLLTSRSIHAGGKPRRALLQQTQEEQPQPPMQLQPPEPPAGGVGGAVAAQHRENTTAPAPSPPADSRSSFIIVLAILGLTVGGLFATLLPLLVCCPGLFPTGSAFILPLLFNNGPPCVAPAARGVPAPNLTRASPSHPTKRVTSVVPAFGAPL
jgi:hypothetical protein